MKNACYPENNPTEHHPSVIYLSLLFFSIFFGFVGLIGVYFGVYMTAHIQWYGVPHRGGSTFKVVGAIDPTWKINFLQFSANFLQKLSSSKDNFLNKIWN